MTEQTPQERIAKVEWEVGLNDKVTFVHLPFEDVIWLLSVARTVADFADWRETPVFDRDKNLAEHLENMLTVLYTTPGQKSDDAHDP